MPLIQRSDTLVISSYPPDWDELAQYTCASHKRYCDARGYDYHADRSDVVDHYAWFDLASNGWRKTVLPIKGFIKLDLFLRFLPLYRTVIWLDADMVVTNAGFRILDLMARELLLPFDFNGHNATVIAAHSVDIVYDFFWACNNTGRKLFLNHDWKEMEAMRYFLQTPPYADIASYEPIKTLCPILASEYEPYVPRRVSEKYAWEPGDFAIHLSALPLARRIELARFYAEQL